MIANGNSFGLGVPEGNSCGIQDPEAAERLGDRFMWGWSGFQKVGNAL